MEAEAGCPGLPSSVGAVEIYDQIRVGVVLEAFTHFFAVTVFLLSEILAGLAKRFARTRQVQVL